MRRNLVLAFLVFSYALATNAQLNDYKYIIVPKRFDVFRTANEYQTSVLIKHLFANEGFTVVYDDAIPEDGIRDRCLGLTVGINDESALFVTRFTLSLNDCEGNTVFNSVQGKSKEKEYKKAYRETITEAFESYKGLNYAYQPKEANETKEKEETKEEKPLTISFKNDVKSLQVDNNKPEKTPIKTDLRPNTENLTETFKAQPIENGFQLVDESSTVKLRMVKTTIDNVYLVNDSEINGMIYLKDGKWYLESTTSGNKQVKELDIKF